MLWETAFTGTQCVTICSTKPLMQLLGFLVVVVKAPQTKSKLTLNAPVPQKRKAHFSSLPALTQVLVNCCGAAQGLRKNLSFNPATPVL